MTCSSENETCFYRAELTTPCHLAWRDLVTATSAHVTCSTWRNSLFTLFNVNKECWVRITPDSGSADPESGLWLSLDGDIRYLVTSYLTLWSCDSSSAHSALDQRGWNNTRSSKSSSCSYKLMQLFLSAAQSLQLKVSCSEWKDFHVPPVRAVAWALSWVCSERPHLLVLFPKHL